MVECIGLSIAWLTNFVTENNRYLLDMSSLQVFETLLKPAINEKCRSYADLVQTQKSEHKHVGKATSFISHEWSCSFIELIRTLEHWCVQHPSSQMDRSVQDGGFGKPQSGRFGKPPSGHFFWIDIFSLCDISRFEDAAASFDIAQATIGPIISEIDHTIVILSPLPIPRYLNDARCRHELRAAHAAGVGIVVLIPPAHRTAALAHLRETGDLLVPIVADEAFATPPQPLSVRTADGSGEAAPLAESLLKDSWVRPCAMRKLSS